MKMNLRRLIVTLVEASALTAMFVTAETTTAACRYVYVQGQGMVYVCETDPNPPRCRYVYIPGKGMEYVCS
jgi:hypothetical protein